MKTFIGFELLILYQPAKKKSPKALFIIYLFLLLQLKSIHKLSGIVTVYEIRIAHEL